MRETEPLCNTLRQARLDQSIKQAELARQLGVSQAAISQFERGNTSALSYAKIQEAANVLSVAIAPEKSKAEDAFALSFCERADCLANVRYESRGKAIVRPRMIRGPISVSRFCGECGDILLDHCPNDDCGQSVTEGSFCVACGTPYIHPFGSGENPDKTGSGNGFHGSREQVLDRTRPILLT